MIPTGVLMKVVVPDGAATKECCVIVCGACDDQAVRIDTPDRDLAAILAANEHDWHRFSPGWCCPACSNFLRSVEAVR